MRDWLRWTRAWLTPIWLCGWLRRFCTQCDRIVYRWHDHPCPVITGDAATAIHDAISRNGPSCGELWQRAAGDHAEYRRLMIDHGYLIKCEHHCHADGTGHCDECESVLPCGWPRRLADRESAGQPSITCPACGMTSYHPDDIREGYCGNCHDWTGAAR